MPVLLATNGTLALYSDQSNYKILSNGTFQAYLEVGGANISAGQLGNYNPVALLSVAGGYEVMWKDSTTGSFVGLDFDLAGNFTSAATTTLIGSSYALENLEPSFTVDLNGDGKIGLKSSTIETSGQYSLVDVADEFEITSGGVKKAILLVSNSPIVSGQFGGYTPDAVLSNGGYEVMFKSGTGYLGLEFDASGNYLSAATALLAGSSYPLEQLESTFNFDLNGDSLIGVYSSTIETSGQYSLVQVADEYEIASGGVKKAILQVSGSPIVSDQFAGFYPEAVLSNGGGYEVMFKSGSIYWGFQFDANGNYISAATSLLSGASYALENLEGSFNLDLNNDGKIGVSSSVLTSSIGSALALKYTQAELLQVADRYEVEQFTIAAQLINSAFLSVSGTLINSTDFGGFIAVAVDLLNGATEVVFKNASIYRGFYFDNNGNYTSPATDLLSGSSYALESLEAVFGVDINGDGTIGVQTTTIEVSGAYSLVKAADEFEITNGGVVQAILKVGANPIVSGQFGGFSPVAVMSGGGAYEVMFRSGTSFQVFDFDGGGTYTGPGSDLVSGGSFALESLETSFNQDINGDGTVGLKTTLVTSGTVTIAKGKYITSELFQVADRYKAVEISIVTQAVTSAFLEVQGAPIVSGHFGGFTPVAIEQAAGGAEVVFQSGTSFVALDFDSAGNYTGPATSLLAGSSYALESLEAAFNIDLNGDGTIGLTETTIITENYYALYKIADEFEVTSKSTTQGILTVSGSPIVSGQFAGFDPVAVASATGGYEVMFKSNTSLLGLNFDTSGNYTGPATSVIALDDYVDVWTQEFQFSVDLNGDGYVGPYVGPIQVDRGTTLSLESPYFYLSSGALANVPIAFGGVPFIDTGSLVPIGALANTGGYEVIWSEVGKNEYAVWQFDATGNYVSAVVSGSASDGLLTGQDFALEQLEPSFVQDLNGDGRLSQAVSANVSNLNLVGNSKIYTVTLQNNSDLATGTGLAASTVTGTGTPSYVQLGSLADTIELTLAPAAGIDQVVGFTYGVHELNIDLKGAASSVLKAAATMFGGGAAISLYSTADPYHGFVLTGYGAGVTAANILTNHTTFVGGHALIT